MRKVVVKETEAALKPKSVDHVQAAAISVVGLAAWQALFDTAALNKGQRVLIHGAAGGVGSFAVQLAKWKGSHVIGTASERNQAFLRELGVDEPIDYEKTRFEDVVRDVDVVLDTLGGETQNRSWKVLKNGGILVSIVAPPSAEEAAKHGVRSAFFSAHPSSSQLSEIAKHRRCGETETSGRNRAAAVRSPTRPRTQRDRARSWQDSLEDRLALSRGR
jgi:NADPH:quinone reductase-like Zn-dependent oxidoreductase